MNLKLSVFFYTVTLDYHSLVLLTVKKDNEEFVLGGKGYSCEFCLYCTAIRVIIVYFLKDHNTSRQVLLYFKHDVACLLLMLMLGPVQTMRIKHDNFVTIFHSSSSLNFSEKSVFFLIHPGKNVSLKGVTAGFNSSSVLYVHATFVKGLSVAGILEEC